MLTEPEPAPRRVQRRYDRLAVLDQIDTFQQQHAASPSQRIIARALGLSAPSVAHNALHGLEQAGLLRITITQPGWPAKLEITPAGRERLAAWRAARATPSADDGGAA
ncbi:MAG TPA: hypothetical protein VFZ66_13720 [Herpetosiphonaceae bacterium]